MDARWADVWSEAFEQSAYNFVFNKEECVKGELGVKVLRLAEIAESSFL